MADIVIYAGIWKDDQLLALASAEADYKGSNAEDDRLCDATPIGKGKD